MERILTRHELLAEIHRAYRPRSYLEIGIKSGRSLALSRTPTIAVDPAFKITSEIHCDVQVVKATSDDFFARDDALAHFPHPSVDLAYIDGLHLFEFALRDFINTERYAHWTSVILVDDILPRSVAEASRDRGEMRMWTGDVFKLTEVLGLFRPDLLTLPLATDPTGVLLVLGAEPQSRALEERYDKIVADRVHPDPQHVPDSVLHRERAVDPDSLAYSGIWNDLRRAREIGLTRENGWDDVRRSVEAAARPAERREATVAERELPRPAKAKRRKPRGRMEPSHGIPRRTFAALRQPLRPLRRRLLRRLASR